MSVYHPSGGRPLWWGKNQTTPCWIVTRNLTDCRCIACCCFLASTAAASLIEPRQQKHVLRTLRCFPYPLTSPIEPCKGLAQGWGRRTASASCLFNGPLWVSQETGVSWIEPVLPNLSQAPEPQVPWINPNQQFGNQFALSQQRLLLGSMTRLKE